MSDRENQVRRVSFRQLELLWEYLSSHKDIADAHNRSLESKAYAESKWREVADLLNSQSEGAYKDWRAWCKYWVDYKAKLKKKSAFIASAQNKNRIGHPTQPLTQMDLKFLQILNKGFGQRLTGVRVNPFSKEAARRALVRSSRVRAEAAVRSSHALEMIGHGISEINQRLSNIEDIFLKVIHGDSK